MGFLLQADGRWNRFGEYGCLYTALSPGGARSEFIKMLDHAGISPAQAAPRDLVSIEVRAVNVFDLTDPTILKSLAINARTLVDDSDASMESCRIIADYARSQGNNAILSPSAAAKGETNLNIYIDIPPAANLTLSVGPDRVPLN